MSTAEPIMPPHQERPDVTAADIDDDRDVDVFPDAADPRGDASEAPVHYPANPAFHTPVPGAALSEAELESDLDEDVSD